MVYDKVNAKKTRIIVIHIMIALLALISIIFFVSNPSITSNFPVIISVVTLLLIFISIYLHRIKLKKTLLGKSVILVSSEAIIPFPTKFKCKSSSVSKYVKRYAYKNHQIPESFVEFIEGRTIYLYKPTDLIDQKSAYKIVAIHQFAYILLEDESRKKSITHLKNISLINV